MSVIAAVCIAASVWTDRTLLEQEFGGYTVFEQLN